MAARARNILVGYDGSEAAQRALDAADDLTGYGSSLAVVSVAPEAETLDEPTAPDGSVTARRLLSEARSLLLRRHVTARYIEPVGEPAEMLMETARELDADLIVVGRREQSPLRRLVLGSVSSKVLHGADCDVLVIR